MFQTLLYTAAIKASEVGIPQVAGDERLLNNIIAMVYTVIGAVAVFYIIRGGLLFVTSGGDPNDVKQARTTILIAAGSLVLATSVFLIINFFIQRLG